jgi:AcrR family transcriptional regulator
MKTTLTLRKKPLQRRSEQMVDDIVKGAIRVLKQQGGRRFTTIRVAQETGISVGSLYQYFPNKESILFQVQQQEWAETSGILMAMIEDRRYSPPVRLKRTVKAFFDSEWEEASLRKALTETGVNLDKTKEFIEMRSAVFSKINDFITEAVPEMPPGRRRFTAEFVFTTMSSLAEEVTTQARSQSEIRQWATNCAQMLLLFLGKTT